MAGQKVGTTKAVAGGCAASSNSTKVSRGASPFPLFIPISKMVTLETVLYLLCHVACFSTLMFATGDTLFLFGKRWSTFWWKEQLPPYGSPVGGAYDVFAKTIAVGNRPVLPPRQLNSDLVLSLLVVLTYNGFFLALCRAVGSYRMEKGKEDKQQGFKEHASSFKTDGDCGVSDSKGFFSKQVDCHNVIYNITLWAVLVLCVLIPTCVISQSPNVVRGTAPCVTLLSSVVPIRYGDHPNGVLVLERFYSIYQMIVIVILVGLVLDANLLAIS